MIEALLVMLLIAGIAGALLGYAARRFRVESDPVVEQIDACLPQTQCAQCGYPGCRPYAEAIAEGRADINQCPPGGEATVQALAELLGREAKPLNPENGEHKPPLVALVDESRCIGCTLCIQACPVDAIVGAAQRMHTVIADECTGCELCLPPCPVDCIDMVESPPQLQRTPPLPPKQALEQLVAKARIVDQEAIEQATADHQAKHSMDADR